MKYNIIYADPPWDFKNKKTGGSMKSGAASCYMTTKNDDVMKIDVPSICAENCVLIMWYVSSQPKEAIALAESWGFEVKHMNGFVWNKLTKTGKPFFGMGFRSRAGAECAMIAEKGKIKPICKSVRQVRSEPVGKHSAKPPEFRDDILKLYGDLPRLEMFARGVVDGWDVFGNEAPDSIEIPMRE